MGAYCLREAVTQTHEWSAQTQIFLISALREDMKSEVIRGFLPEKDGLFSSAGWQQPASTGRLPNSGHGNSPVRPALCLLKTTPEDYGMAAPI